MIKFLIVTGREKLSFVVSYLHVWYQGVGTFKMVAIVFWRCLTDFFSTSFVVREKKWDYHLNFFLPFFYLLHSRLYPLCFL